MVHLARHAVMPDCNTFADLSRELAHTATRRPQYEASSTPDSTTQLVVIVASVCRGILAIESSCCPAGAPETQVLSSVTVTCQWICAWKPSETLPPPPFDPHCNQQGDINCIRYRCGVLFSLAPRSRRRPHFEISISHFVEHHINSYLYQKITCALLNMVWALYSTLSSLI